MTNNILDIKKHSNVLARLISTAHMQEHGVECYFNNAATSINFGHSRSEILGALKKDISRTAEDLNKGQEIINSIKGGRVVEYDSIYNTTEEVFGLAFNKNENTITLSGVSFDLAQKVKYTKADLAQIIYKTIFGIDAKELSATIKAITRYEDATMDIDKAVLFPSLAKADEMIKKITAQDIKYSSYRSGMDYNEKAKFDATFKRTGVDGVIQSSTYIDASGTKQLASSHDKLDAKELEFALTASRFKYINAVEVDSDGDLAKTLRAIRQIERLDINTNVQFTLKFRKLGNLKATGVCYAGHRMIAEDVRDTSALLHEIAHHVHLITLVDNKFVNYMIQKLTPMIDLKNIKEEHQDWASKKSEYFNTPTEVVARALEVASLFAQEQGKMISGDDEFMMVKNRKHYEEMEGIYFNFTQFDDETVEEFYALFELFFNTAHNSIEESHFDNFIKKDTQYKRVDRELSMMNILRREASKAEKSKRALYAMVDAQNIKVIIENRGKVSISELATTIMSNISYCGNHKARMSASDWAEAIEVKSEVVNTLVNALEEQLSLKEFISYLIELKSHAWKNVLSTVFLGGFSGDKFRMSLRKELKERESDAYFNIAAFKKTVMDKHPISLANKEILEDKEFIKTLIDSHSDSAKYLNASLISIDLLREYVLYAFGEEPTIFIMHPALVDDKTTMDILVAKNTTGYISAGEGYKNNPEYIKNAIDNLGFPFHHLGKELKDNKEFITPYVRENPELLENISLRLQKDPDILGLFDDTQREIDSLENATTGRRFKIARNTTHVEVLNVLAKDKNMDVRQEVAKRDICDSEVLMRFSKLKSEYIRHEVAANPNTPKSVLSKLIASKDSWVLQGAAKSVNLSKHKAVQLSELDNRPTLNNLVCNKNVLEMNYDLIAHREIVRNCIDGDEEYFYHKFKTDTDFTPSYKFMYDMIKNISLYMVDGGYMNSFLELLTGMIKHTHGRDWEKFGPAVEKELASVMKVTKEDSRDEAFETLVTADKVEDGEDFFEKLIATGEIVDFIDTRDSTIIHKVLKIATRLEKDVYKKFNRYMKTSQKSYYSRFAEGFIMKNKEVTKAASVTATLYSADALQTFASGTLF